MAMVETKKRKKDNLLWELDLTEARLGSDGKSRLLKAKKAVEKAAKRNSKSQDEGQDQSERTNLENKALELRKEYVSRKIHYSLRQIRRSMKTARAYEAQKIIRRLKAYRSAKDHDGKIHRIEQELIVNKSLDAETLSKSWLVKALEKHKVLGKNRKNSQDEGAVPVIQYLPEWMLEFDTSNLYKTSCESARNVHSRIVNYPVIQTCINESVERIVAAAKGERVKPTRQDKEEDYYMNQSEEELEESDADTMVASASSGDDEGESETSQDEKKSASSHPRKESASIDISSSEDSSTEESEPARKKAKKSDGKTSRRDKVPQPNNNMVITSLASGYISDDDGSVPSDIDNGYDSDDASVLKPKKNRRGQRARQKIWEAKYGRGAKHLVQQVEEKKAKQDQWRERQDRRDAAAAAAVAKSEESDKNHLHQSRQSNIANSSASTDKPIHPSWEAKKASQGSIANLAFSKPKKVFD